MDLNLEGTANNDILDGGEGNDSIFGGEGNDTIDGGEGNDIIDGGEGNDCIDGGDGNDILIGFFGDDTINGSSGNDTLIGFSGNDTLIGGDGNDVFVFDPEDLSGFDTIEDFVVGEDTLEIRPVIPPGGGIPEGGIPEGGIPGGGIPEGGIPGGGTPEGGIPSSDLEYDRHTGLLSVDGNSIAQLPSGLDLDFKSDNNNPPTAQEDTSTDDSAGGVPVVTLSTDVSKVNEGENLALNFELSSPVPAGGLTVELDLIEGSDFFAQGFEFLPEASSNIANLEFIVDDTGEVTGAEVSLAEGATDASIVSEIVADNITEGDESVSLGLVDLDDYDVDGGNVNFTIIDTSTDLNTSVEVEDVRVPFLGDVDFAVAIDYNSGIDASHFVSELAISDSIENYLTNELQELDISELIVDDLAEFLASDSGLGIGSISEFLTLDVSIAPNALISEPILVTSTVFA